MKSIACVIPINATSDLFLSTAYSQKGAVPTIELELGNDEKTAIPARVLQSALADTHGLVRKMSYTINNWRHKPTDESLELLDKQGKNIGALKVTARYNPRDNTVTFSFEWAFEKKVRSKVKGPFTFTLTHYRADQFNTMLLWGSVLTQPS